MRMPISIPNRFIRPFAVFCGGSEKGHASTAAATTWSSERAGRRPSYVYEIVTLQPEASRSPPVAVVVAHPSLPSPRSRSPRAISSSAAESANALPPSIPLNVTYLGGRSGHTTGGGDTAQCTPHRTAPCVSSCLPRICDGSKLRSVGRWKGFDAAAKFIRGMCASILRAFILSTAFAVFRGRERESCEGETTD